MRKLYILAVALLCASVVGAGELEATTEFENLPTLMPLTF